MRAPHASRAFTFALLRYGRQERLDDLRNGTFSSKVFFRCRVDAPPDELR